MEFIVTVREQQDEPHKDEHRHGPGYEELCHVVANVRVPECQHLGKVQELVKAGHLPCQDLLASSRGDLGEEEINCAALMLTSKM